VLWTTGIICLWAAFTIRQQGALVYLLALGVLLAGCGRLLSISKVGLPKPTVVWLGYPVPELLIPFVMAAAHYAGPVFDCATAQISTRPTCAMWMGIS
jgi:hypothetical protein